MTNPRYQRQVSLPGFGPQAQQKLADAHVAVVGAGGLGSPALLYLAAAGVGRITIIDDDVVDVTNLHRQVIHRTDVVGEAKGDSASAALGALNPDVDTLVQRARLEPDNALDLLADADIVLDGADNFAARHTASWAAARLGIPHVWAAILGFDAQLSVFHAGHGPIYEDVFPTPPPPGAVPSCAQAGVLGPVVGIVGSAMALEAIKLLTGIGTPLIGRLGYFSALDATWEYIPLRADPAVAARVIATGPVRCATPNEPDVPDVPEVTDIPPGARIIDVRTADERAAGFIPGSEHFPLDRILAGALPDGLDDFSGPVVFYCASGVRSAAAVAAVAAVAKPEGRGLECFSLRGGYLGQG